MIVMANGDSSAGHPLIVASVRGREKTIATAVQFHRDAKKAAAAALDDDSIPQQDPSKD